MQQLETWWINIEGKFLIILSDIVCSDYKIFTKLKYFLGGKRFESNKSKKLLDRHNICLSDGGDYVEKWKKLHLYNNFIFK